MYAYVAETTGNLIVFNGPPYLTDYSMRVCISKILMRSVRNSQLISRLQQISVTAYYYAFDTPQPQNNINILRNDLRIMKQNP
jgi:hypothetical protein